MRAEFSGFSRPGEYHVCRPKRPCLCLLSAVRTIPPGSVILYIWHTQTDPGSVVYSDAVARLVADAAPVPVYGTSDFYIGTGVVGGVVRGTRETGTRIGDMALRDPRRHAAPGHSHRDRAGHAGHRLAPGAAVGHRPLSSPSRIANRISRALGLGALPALHCRRRDGPAGAGGVDRRAGHSTDETAERPNSRCVEVRRRCARATSASAIWERGCCMRRTTERSRIARDLHDDISQQMAASFEIDLELLGQRCPKATQQGLKPSEALTRAQSEIAKSVHDLSHRLHPARLRARRTRGRPPGPSTRDGTARLDHDTHTRQTFHPRSLPISRCVCSALLRKHCRTLLSTVRHVTYRCT